MKFQIQFTEPQSKFNFDIGFTELIQHRSAYGLDIHKRTDLEKPNLDVDVHGQKRKFVHAVLWRRWNSKSKFRDSDRFSVIL